MDSEGFIIREAKKEDCDVIMQLIKELASHVQMSDRPRTSAEVLRRDGFGDDRLFRCTVADVNCSGTRTIVGYAIYYFAYSTWDGSFLFLDDLYVKPEYRGRGIGTALWREVARICLQSNCARMDWMCVSCNLSSMEYYKRKGGTDLTEKEQWHLFRMELEDLKAFANEEDPSFKQK